MKTAGIVCAMAALPMALMADRVATSLSGEGWTADGVPVAVPHTWNAIDGADGGDDPAKAFTSCSAQSYARKAVTYAREDYQAGVHYVNYRAILRDPRVWGAFVWELFDSGSDNRKESVRYGINNKGLIAFDHRTPKAAFWFYKANWNPEPMLYLLGCDRAEMPGPLTQVCGFCNAGPVTLSVNGRVVGEKAPDEVKTVLWLDVPIADGENRIELKCGGLKASAVWRATSRMVTDRGHVCHDTMESRI